MANVEYVAGVRSPHEQKSSAAGEPKTPHATRLTVAGLQISAYIEEGRGAPVVFLHGNSSSKAVWAHQFDVARQLGRGIVAPDLPGHGESENSPTPAETYSFPGYAAVVSQLLDGLEINCADIVGWSLGGHIGLELFATEPRIRSLLIVGSPPARPCPEALTYAFHATDDMQLAGKDKFSRSDAMAYGAAMMGGPEFLSGELLHHIERTDGQGRRFMFTNALSGVGIDQQAAVETVEKPLCVVHGEREPFVRLDYLCSLRYRALWNDRIYVIAETGHAPHWECPDAFNGVLASFLQSSGQAGAEAESGLIVANRRPAAHYLDGAPTVPGPR